jgi:hypothetical protein
LRRLLGRMPRLEIQGGHRPEFSGVLKTAMRNLRRDLLRLGGQ